MFDSRKALAEHKIVQGRDGVVRTGRKQLVPVSYRTVFGILQQVLPDAYHYNQQVRRLDGHPTSGPCSVAGETGPEYCSYRPVVLYERHRSEIDVTATNSESVVSRYYMRHIEEQHTLIGCICAQN